jgi:hypothetical protein
MKMIPLFLKQILASSSSFEAIVPASVGCRLLPFFLPVVRPDWIDDEWLEEIYHLLFAALAWPLHKRPHKTTYCGLTL